MARLRYAEAVRARDEAPGGSKEYHRAVLEVGLAWKQVRRWEQALWIAAERAADDAVPRRRSDG